MSNEQSRTSVRGLFRCRRGALSPRLSLSCTRGCAPVPAVPTAYSRASSRHFHALHPRLSPFLLSQLPLCGTCSRLLCPTRARRMPCYISCPTFPLPLSRRLFARHGISPASAPFSFLLSQLPPLRNLLAAFVSLPPRVTHALLYFLPHLSAAFEPAPFCPPMALALLARQPASPTSFVPRLSHSLKAALLFCCPRFFLHGS